MKNNSKDSDSEIGNIIPPETLKKLAELAQKTKDGDGTWETNPDHPFYNSEKVEKLKESAENLEELAKRRTKEG